MPPRDIPPNTGEARFAGLIASMQQNIQMLLRRSSEGGPPGPAGPAGAAGATGATGPTGPVGPGAVYKNGTLLGAPIIASGVNIITSTGIVGPYSITFAPVVFAVAPVVTAWCSKDGFGNVVVLNMDSVTASLFSLDMTIATSGAAVNVGQTITVEWMAVGS